MNAFSLSDIECLMLVVDICGKYGVHPLVPIESETYFRKLLDDYDGDASNERMFSDWLSQHVSGTFIALKRRPKWMQEPEWPFFEGEPMIFVGQIDISVQGDNPALKMFHDDTSFYVFINRTGVRVTEVIIQQY